MLEKQQCEVWHEKGWKIGCFFMPPGGHIKLALERGPRVGHQCVFPGLSNHSERPQDTNVGRRLIAKNYLKKGFF